MTDRMTVDVWLRGTDFATTATIEGSPRPPRSWTDEDVRQVLEAMLRAMDRLKRHWTLSTGLAWLAFGVLPAHAQIYPSFRPSMPMIGPIDRYLL